MTSNHNKQEPSEFDGVLDEILDQHAEYYIRQTMKFFQENGESPALSKNNSGDIKAKQAIKAAIADRDKLIDRIELIDETGRVYVKGSIYGSPVSVRLSYQDDGKTLKVFVEDKL